MPLFLTSDAAMINAYVNHPAVLPFCGYPAGARVDVGPRLADGDLFFLTDGEGAMIALHVKPGGVEKHNLFLPSCRGGAAIKVGKSMMAWAAQHVGDPHARTPTGNRAARWFNRRIGMKSAGMSMSPIVGPVEDFVYGGATCH